MRDADTGNVFNIQRFSLDDGPGIRTCVFLKGCPLSCLWCHNGESQSALSELFYDKRKCILCGGCASVCDSGCHIISEDKHIFDRLNCTGCGKCADICPAKALERVGSEMTVGEVMRKVLADKEFYGKDGGMTLTGGEPMLQFDFALSLAKSAKENGISVAMETSGYADNEKFKEILPYVDYFLFDCKASHADHMRLTGKDDGLILDNLDFLYQNNANVTLRCPVVDGGNLNEAFTDKICLLAEKYPNLTAIQFMPYHDTGTGKAELLGKTAQRKFKRPDNEILEKLKEKLEKVTKVHVLY